MTDRTSHDDQYRDATATTAKAIDAALAEGQDPPSGTVLDFSAGARYLEPKAGSKSDKAADKLGDKPVERS